MAKRIVQMLVTCAVETDQSREEVRAEVERTLTDDLHDTVVELVESRPLAGTPAPEGEQNA